MSVAQNFSTFTFFVKFWLKSFGVQIFEIFEKFLKNDMTWTFQMLENMMSSKISPFGASTDE